MKRIPVYYYGDFYFTLPSFTLILGRICMIHMNSVRKITTIAILSAASAVLMFLEFPVGIAPSFLKLDFSELPALIASFAYGPLYGVLVCLIKNLINLPFSESMMVGELANFLIGVCFVVPAGLIYRFHKTKKGAVIGSLTGALLMAVLSVPVNYYITYPIYAQLFANGDMSVIVGMYTALYKGMDTLPKALIYCNMPFTFAKGLIDFILTLLIYKHISPLLKGKKTSR